MRVALLTNGIYPFTMGGMQKHSYYLVRYLAKRKVEVDLYYFETRKNKNIDIKEHIPSHELHHINLYKRNFPASFYFPGHYLYNSYRYSKNIFRILKQNMGQVDFIYVQGFSGWKLLETKGKRKDYPPIGVNFHGLEMFQPPANFRNIFERYLLRYPAKYCIRHADYAFSLGGHLTEILNRLTDSSRKIWTTPIGIEKEWLIEAPQMNNSRRKFVFIGRFERRKGIQELQKVIQKLGKTYKFDFEFIGPIPHENRIQISNCQYYGAIYDEERNKEILSKADVLVCPSYSEGMPTVILEAMSRGLAVIATDVGAVGELVSEQTGWLIKPASLEELEKAMIEAVNLSDEKLLQKKIAAYRLIKNRFTWDNVIDITLKKIKSSF